MEYGLHLPVKKLCDYAYNGKQAIEAVVNNVEANEGRHCSYNLILIDCNMPFMDGYEATKCIREYLFDKGIE